MREVVMRRRDDHADDQIDQAEDEADEPAQERSPRSSPRSIQTVKLDVRIPPSLLRGVRIEYVSFMHVHEVLGKRQPRVELLAADMAHADLWIASLFVLFSQLRHLLRRRFLGKVMVLDHSG